MNLTSHNSGTNQVVSDSALQSEEFREFSGNPGLFVITSLVIPLAIVLVLSAYWHVPLVFAIVLFSLWSIQTCFVSYYFSVSENFLLIQNRLIPWFQLVLRFTQIRSFVFESRNYGRRTTNALRIIPRDSDEFSYGSVVLSDESWVALKKALVEKKVPVTDKIGLDGKE